MRTNIDIDDAVLDAAMQAGPFKTKKDAVDAGLRLLARQTACREILRWEGKLAWDGDEPAAGPAAAAAAAKPAAWAGAVASSARLVQEPAPAPAVSGPVHRSPRRHAGR